MPTCTRREEPLPLSLTLCGAKMATLYAASLHLIRGSTKTLTVATQKTGVLLCLIFEPVYCKVLYKDILLYSKIYDLPL